MNFIRVTCAAGVLLVGTMVPAYAQRDQQGDKQGNPEEQDKGGPQRAQQPQKRQQQKQAQPPQRARSLNVRSGRHKSKRRSHGESNSRSTRSNSNVHSNTCFSPLPQWLTVRHVPCNGDCQKHQNDYINPCTNLGNPGYRCDEVSRWMARTVYHDRGARTSSGCTRRFPPSSGSFSGPKGG